MKSKPKLHLFWIAEYQDGTALPQFDPDTGEEHLFKEIDHSKLKRFGWYSFPYDMVGKIPEAVFSLVLDRYTVEIPQGEKLTAYRTTTLKVTLDGQPKKHEANEYVLGLEDSPLMHIFTDGRVELK